LAFNWPPNFSFLAIFIFDFIQLSLKKLNMVLSNSNILNKLKLRFQT
jgi:hypothetical protein